MDVSALLHPWFFALKLIRIFLVTIMLLNSDPTKDFVEINHKKVKESRKNLSMKLILFNFLTVLKFIKGLWKQNPILQSSVVPIRHNYLLEHIYCRAQFFTVSNT